MIRIRLTSFVVNDFNWSSKAKFLKIYLTKIQANLKTLIMKVKM